jgi:hypothetical protein
MNLNNITKLGEKKRKKYWSELCDSNSCKIYHIIQLILNPYEVVLNLENYHNMSLFVTKFITILNRHRPWTW